jgi:hypothetical protein
MSVWSGHTVVEGGHMGSQMVNKLDEVLVIPSAGQLVCWSVGKLVF